MRGVVWLVLLFVVAVVAATTLGSNDGVVSIYWGGWRTDLSLNLFVLLLVGVCIVLASATQAINSLISLPARAREWRGLRRERAAQAALREAQTEFFGARYSRAHRSAQRALAIQDETPALRADGEFSVLARLLSAGSLHRLRDRNRRDEVMQQLQSSLRKGGSARAADDGARLLAIEWALEDRDTDRALEGLAELPPGVARRTQALRLKLQATRMARQPLAALQTARLLSNHQAFSKALAQGLLRSLAFEALESAHDADQLRRLWAQFDQADRRDGHVAARAALRAGALGAADDGRNWLRPFWDGLAELPPDEREQVALALMELAGGIGIDWLPRLEAALASHGGEPAVAAAAGVVFAERQLWGKARRPLEQAAASSALPSRSRRRAWRLLAQLAREEGDEARAQRAEQSAAALD
jgi:HemY protein